MNEVLGINGFIKKIIALYPASFKNDQFIIDTWSEAAVRNLYNPKVDYSKLLDIVISNNPRGNFAPDFPWMIEESKRCYLKEKSKNLYVHAVILDPIYGETDICVNQGITQEQLIRALCQKRPNTNAQDWIIKDWRS